MRVGQRHRVGFAYAHAHHQRIAVDAADRPGGMQPLDASRIGAYEIARAARQDRRLHGLIGQQLAEPHRAGTRDQRPSCRIGDVDEDVSRHRDRVELAIGVFEIEGGKGDAPQLVPVIVDRHAEANRLAAG